MVLWHERETPFHIITSPDSVHVANTPPSLAYATEVTVASSLRLLWGGQV
jgi:hypothetical protein